MKKLIAISNNVSVDYDLSADEVVWVDVKTEDNNFVKIAKCGLAIEEYLNAHGVNLLFSNTDKYTLASIIWKTPTTEFVNTELSWLQHIRGDELLFPTLNQECDISWTSGNPRALIKWAACCVDLNLSTLNPGYRYAASPDQVKLVWLAQRIGLKAYGQSL